MQMTTIYLIRHAEAEGNLCRRIHGQYDTNVTTKGRRQLLALRDRFADIPVDACYASDLTRTKTTAQAIWIPKGLELHPDPAFREIGLGVWEDLPFGYLNTFQPEAIQCFNQDPRNWHVEGSETFTQYTDRFLAGLERIVRTHPDQTVAVVSHAAVMRGLLIRLFPELRIGRCDNTAVTRLEYDRDGFRVLYCMDNSHLSPELSSLRRPSIRQQDGAQGSDTLWFLEEAAGCFTALEAQRPVGTVRLSEEDASTGRIDELSLIPSYRGFGLGVQLLGQAIFTMRPRGKRWLRIYIPTECTALERLCAKLAFAPDGTGDWVLDLTVGVRPM